MTEVICLEGIAGAGKTEQAKKISLYLNSKGKSNLVINEKGYEPFKQAVIEWHESGANQNFSLLDILRFAKARAETHRRNFLPLIGKVNYLIFDRCLYTSGVYQESDKISCEEIININTKEGAIKPERGVVCLCQPKTALERTKERRKENYKLPSLIETLDEIRKRRDLYLRLLELHPELHLIDSERPKSEVFEDVKSLLGL